MFCYHDYGIVTIVRLTNLILSVAFTKAICLLPSPVWAEGTVLCVRVCCVTTKLLFNCIQVHYIAQEWMMLTRKFHLLVV